jgi:DNA-binding NarL/FixJ family response regulator
LAAVTGQHSHGVSGLAADVAPSHGLVLIGPAGIGKTTLARAIVDTLAKSHHVQHVRGSRSALNVPLGAYEAVLPPGVQHARAAITYIRDEAARDPKPALLVVDDAHDLDEASAFVTLALASSPGIALLCCRRSGERAPDAIDAIVREQLAREVEVEPLASDEVARLGQERLGGPLGPATASRLAELSGGNPMIVNELIDAGLRTSMLVEQVGAWHWVGDWRSSVRLNNLVEERLDALDPRERDLLELIALAEPIELRALRTAAEATDRGAAFLDDLASLERAGLAAIDETTGDLRVAHPLYAEVLRADLPHARRHHHALVLANLPDDGRPERLVRAVRWKIEAGLDVPSSTLLEAATIAHHREDLRVAAQLARRASEAGEQVRSGRLLGLTLEQLGDIAGAAEALLEAARAAAEPEEAMLLALARSEFAFAHHADPEDASAVLDDIESDYPQLHDLLLPARALQTLLKGDPAGALELAEPKLHRDAEASARFGVVSALALTVVGRASEAVTVGRRAIVARERLDPEAVARHSLFATALVFALVETGSCSEARAIAREGHMAAQRAGAMQGEGWFALARGIAEMASGQISDAGAWFAESAARFAPLASPAVRWAWAGAGLSAAFAGDAPRARSLLAHAETFGPTCWRFLDPLLGRARAWTAAAADDIPSAIVALDEAARIAHDGQLRSLEAVLSADLTRLGAPQQAAERLDALLDCMDNPRLPHWHAYAHALADGDADALVRAAHACNGAGAVAEAADALAQAAALLWRHGEISEATTTAAAAREHASRAQGLVTPALRALAEVPPLTDRQAEIAELAAAGMPSREIASHLVVSVRTVDNHLARIFRTFGISTRAELGDILTAWRPNVATPAAPRATA